MASSARPPLVRRLTTSQWFALAAALLALVTAAGAALGIVAIVRLTDARNVVLDRNGPAVLAQMRLSTALVDQESGVRGYALTGREQFLEPYRGGHAVEREQLMRLGDLLTGDDMAPVQRTTALVEARARIWRRVYADLVIANVRARGTSAGETPDPRLGRRTFDGVREALALQSAALERVRIA
ncbi:MAG TPA: CHASE3 domain-containing protein, partial [Conexibacter sp.]|nr:CHASE3 domain-containing protein [Conexibacter sp.]